MPNIPQMDSVWGDLGDAWVKSTKGSGATGRPGLQGRGQEHQIQDRREAKLHGEHPD